MSRMMKNDVYQKFRTLCLVAGKVPIEKMKAEDRGTSKIIGAWHLDYIPGSGYLIDEVSDTFEKEFPMGIHSRGAAEMVRTMDFAIGVLQSSKWCIIKEQKQWELN